MKKTTQKENELLKKAAQNPKYKGKQVVVIEGKIHILSTRSKKARVKLLTSLIKKHPQSIPTISLIPKDNTLILIS